MNNGIMKIYALAVCFTSLLCCAITASFFLFNMVKLIAPEATIDPNMMHYYASREAYRNSPYFPARARPAAFALGPGGVIMPPAPARNDPTNTPELTEEEIDKLRLQQLDSVITRHTFQARRGVILQIIIMLISMGLFTVHWKLAKKLTQESSV